MVRSPLQMALSLSKKNPQVWLFLYQNVFLARNSSHGQVTSSSLRLIILISKCEAKKLNTMVNWLSGLCMLVSISVSICGAGKAEADVVVIGSGIGGLCCAGLLARYQQDVLVLESHDLPGGAAHSFQIKGFQFDSGPSLFSGFQSKGPQANPLGQVTCSFVTLN